MNELPILLDDIQVASPCAAEWDQMQGDERVRFCGECRKNVFNLSDMTRREAEDVIIEHEGNLCVRFYRRHDGTLLTRDCPIGLAAIRRRMARRLAAMAAVFTALLFGRGNAWRPAWGTEPLTGKTGTPAVAGGLCPPKPLKSPPVLQMPVAIAMPAGWENAAALAIGAQDNWVKAPVTAEPGSRIEIRLDPRFCNVWSSSPTVQNVSAEGDPKVITPTGYCLPGRADGSLVARIADERFYVGTGTTLAAKKPGQVYLSINDDEERLHGEGFKDNQGEMHVLIRAVLAPK